MSGFSFGSSSAFSSSPSTPAFSFSSSSLFGASQSASSICSPLFGTTSSSAALSSSSPLFGTTPSSAAPTSGSPPFGATSSFFWAPTSGSPLFGTTSSVAAPTSGSPLFGTTLSSAAPTSGDEGDEGEQVAREVVKNPMCPNSVEEAKNVSAAAASKAFSVVDEESAETSPLSSLCVEVERHVPSPQNGPIIKRILHKYGDITMGSILRSLDARLAFLDLMGDVVNRLCNHTLETLCSHELQLMEANVTDAAAVGFKVEWLQQRVGEIKAAKYRACSKELDELDKQIEAAKTSLMEMELRREDLARDVAAIKKAKIEGKGFLGCTLSEGLL